MLFRRLTGSGSPEERWAGCEFSHRLSFEVAVDSLGHLTTAPSVVRKRRGRLGDVTGRGIPLKRSSEVATPITLVAEPPSAYQAGGHPGRLPGICS